MKLTAADGVELAVRTEGDGRSVVLVHGATLDATINWDRPGITAAIVDAGYRAILPDLRGHGASDRPIDAAHMRMDDFVDDLRLVLDTFGIDRTPVVGYSLGSMIALETAARDNRVAAIVAGGISLELMHREPVTPELDAYLLQLAAERDEDVTDEKAQQVRAWDRSQGLDPRARAALIRCLRSPWSVDLDAVEVPTLVVNGVDDSPPHSLAATLTDARVALVAGDHASALDDPALARTIIEFLDAQRAS
jgi:pimeloyl-ACP methyl ester carboxylesterase